MRLDSIGFYTMTDERVRNISASSPLYRCELILTSGCNFRCPYCRPLRKECQGVLPYEEAIGVIDTWLANKIKTVKFSGGEPMTYRRIADLVSYAKRNGAERIALSTNGSFPFSQYRRLIDLGVDDFSISLDACCSSVGKIMSGGVDSAWEKVVKNIRDIAKLVYTSVGIVLDEHNLNQARETIRFAHDLGVADIRVIPSAQYNQSRAEFYDFDEEILNQHPILKFRANNFKAGKSIRGLDKEDSKYCYLVRDDMVVANSWHFPCVIYMREGGNPIGKVGSNLRQQRMEWSKSHNCFEDKICRTQCLDFCRKFNNRAREFNV